MTLTKPIPTRGRADQTQLRIRSRFFVDFRRGVTDSLTGQSYIAAGGRELVEATNGIAYVSGDSIANLSNTPGGLGLTGSFGIAYSGVNNQLRISQLPLVPMQIAWHGMLPTADGNLYTLCYVGGVVRGIVLVCDNDGVYAYYESSSAVTATAQVQMTRQQECFVVVQLIPDGATGVRLRLAVKRRVAFDDVAWEIGAASSAITCDLSLDDEVLGVPGVSQASRDRVIYRILYQDGTNDVEDLPWDWTSRRDGLPGTYGLTENGFIQLELDAGNDVYFRAGLSYVSIDTSPPTDYLALAPGGISSPYIYLESLV